MTNKHLYVSTLLFCLAPITLPAATLQVGPGKTYAMPCAAIAAAAPGDTILIDAAGNYGGNVCSWTKNQLTLRGVNGRPKIPANGANAGGKGIWVIGGNDTVVENIEFSGAAVPDRNGAGIRMEANNLTVRNCYFHHNQMGILTNNSLPGELLVEYSEFAFNGNGQGLAHNIYVGHIGKFTLRFSYSHDAQIGHLVKSRAAENYILYNRLTTENGPTSYELDLPNGGLSYVIGNVIQQGVNRQNVHLLAYLMEGLHSWNPNTQLYVVNNTFVNSASGSGYFVLVGEGAAPAVVRNNIFFGPGQRVSQASAVQANNFSGDALFVNHAAFDFHLRTGSPAIDAGADPGAGGSFALNPAYQYVHPTCGQARSVVGRMDLGAFEFNGAGAALGCTSSTGSPALASLTVTPSGLIGGQRATGTVAIDNPAPAGGLAVVISSSNGAVASGPSTVTIAPGATSATFLVTTGGVTKPTTVTLTATYAGVAKTAAVTANPVPLITGLQVKPGPSSATVSWTTNVPAATRVQFGTTASYCCSTATDTAKVLSHSVTLTGLAPSTVYHYRVVSADAFGNQVVSADQTFTTTSK